MKIAKIVFTSIDITAQGEPVILNPWDVVKHEEEICMSVKEGWTPISTCCHGFMMMTTMTMNVDVIDGAIIVKQD